MLLTELLETVQVRSGQFIFDSAEDLNLNLSRFWSIVKPDLSFYDEHRPVTHKRRLYISNTTNHTFLESPNERDYDIPDWVSNVIPVDVPSVVFASAMSPSSGASTRRLLLFRYDKPTLFVTSTSRVEVTCHFERKLIETRDESTDDLTELEILDLTYKDDEFVNLATGRFMEVLGRSRRTFTLNDLPVSMDSSELVNEGNRMVEDAREKIIEQNSWYYSKGN